MITLLLFLLLLAFMHFLEEIASSIFTRLKIALLHCFIADFFLLKKDICNIYIYIYIYSYSYYIQTSSMILTN